MNSRVDEIYDKLKNKPTKYDEEYHCKLILRIMLNQGRPSAFCTEAFICENTFYRWLNLHELFLTCYALGKMYARENWEIEGEKIRDEQLPMGTISYAYEHWKMMGWSRFGISKNSRIKLTLDPDADPNTHYKQLLKQASNGEFTAAEIKQLMEAINVGLNSHQVFELQKEIDQLKSDLAIMAANTDGHNSRTNKGIA